MVKQEEATEIDTTIMIVTVADVAAVVTIMTSEYIVRREEIGRCECCSAPIEFQLKLNTQNGHMH